MATDGPLHREYLDAGWALNDLASGRVPLVDEVVAAVAFAFSLKVSEILGASRTKQFVLPRQVAVYLARELCRRSWPELGREMGRDYSALIVAHRKVAALIATDHRLAEVVTKLRALLTEEVTEAAE